jgi:hypothetical protein
MLDLNPDSKHCLLLLYRPVFRILPAGADQKGLKNVTEMMWNISSDVCVIVFNYSAGSLIIVKCTIWSDL